MQFYFDQAANVMLYPGAPIPALGLAQIGAVPLGNCFAVQRTLRNLQVLRHFNYPVPPIMDDQTYNWPIDPHYKPLAHQKIYANFSVLHPKMFNLGDAGSMKTLSTLWAADFLMRQHAPGTMRALIIAPLTILDSVWASAIFGNFMGLRSFQILTGDEDRRLSRLAKPADFYIINPDGLKVGAHVKRGIVRLDGFAEELAKRKDIQIVIIDEATAFKDHTSGRSRLYAQAMRDRPYQWLLTGTPTNTAPTDAYGLAKIVNNAYNKSFSGFRVETMQKITNFLWKPRADGYEKARRLLTPAVRFTLDEIWDGPEMTFQRRQVELTAEQKKMLGDLKRDLVVVAKSGQAIPAANEAAARWKFLQIVMGSIYDEHHAAHRVDATPRYREVVEIVESTSRKIVVGVPITSVVHRVAEHLTEHFKKQKSGLRCAYINGSVSPKDRGKLIDAFESDPNFKVMIVDPATVSHGVNKFVVADTLIWFGPIDKTEFYLQLNARLRRPGQKYPTTCFQLTATKLEAEIFDRLRTNTSMQGMMLQAIREEKF